MNRHANEKNNAIKQSPSMPPQISNKAKTTLKIFVNYKFTAFLAFAIKYTSNFVDILSSPPNFALTTPMFESNNEGGSA